jgi:hypothetical protein
VKIFDTSEDLEKKRNVIMRTSTKLLTGFILAAALGFGVVGAKAESANGPDAGIGIEGYNLDYEHSADGSGPGYPRHPELQQQQHQYNSYHPRYYHQW